LVIFVLIPHHLFISDH